MKPEKKSLAINSFILATLGLCFLGCTEEKLYKKEFTTSEEKTLAKTLLSGVGYYYQGTVSEQFLTEEALSYDSSNADIWREFGTAQVKRGFAKNMYFYYGEAAKRDPISWQGWRGYIYLYFYRDFDRAILDFNEVDSLIGAVAYSQGQSHDYMRGVAYYGLEDYDTALYFLSKYIDEITDEQGVEWVDVYAILYRGLIYKKLGNTGEAISNFELALEVYPSLADAHFHLAEIDLKLGQLISAKKRLVKAETNFEKGYYHNRPYIEVLDQLYRSDFTNLRAEIDDLSL